jgi:outer membrane protein TolC
VTALLLWIGIHAAVADPVEGWWRDFGDPNLNAWVEASLDANLDIDVATTRIEAARGLADAARAPLLPSVTFDYNLSGVTDDVRAGQSGFLTTDVLPDFIYNGSGQLGLGVEVDLTGRNVLAWQAARGDVSAAEQDRAVAAQAIALRVVAAWWDVALAQERIAALDAQRAVAASLLTTLERRQARSEGTVVEVLQQRQQIAALDAQRPSFIAAAKVAAAQLAVLAGKSPQDAPTEIPTQLPTLAAVTDDPAREVLLRDRPDLRAADLRFSAAHQRRLSRERAFAPKVRLNLNLSGQYSNTQRIQFGATGTTVDYGSAYGWTVGTAISLPIFDGGLTIANLRQARAAEATAEAQRDAATLAAEAQVATARIQEEGAAERVVALADQVSLATQAFEAARARFELGLVDWNTLLNAENALWQASLNAIAARRDVVTARTNRLDARGGAWTAALFDGDAP